MVSNLLGEMGLRVLISEDVSLNYLISLDNHSLKMRDTLLNRQFCLIQFSLGA